MVAMIASNQLSGYPLIAEVTQKPNKRYKFFLVLFLLLQAAFGLVNVYVLAEHFLSSTSPHVTETTILAFNTMLVIWGTYYLQRLKDRTSEISKLERLYRDVAIHNIEDEDAIARLNEELLGYQFGDWLEQKLAQVRQCADELKNKLEEMKPLLEGILALDKDLRFEVKGRLDAYKKGLNAKYDSYIKVFAALGNWLEISKRAANDEYIVDALAKTIAGLVAIHSQLLHQRDKTIELIDSTSAHANNEVNKLEAFEKTSLPMGDSKKNDAT